MICKIIVNTKILISRAIFGKRSRKNFTVVERICQPNRHCSIGFNLKQRLIAGKNDLPCATLHQMQPLPTIAHRTVKGKTQIGQVLDIIRLPLIGNEHGRLWVAIQAHGIVKLVHNLRLNRPSTVTQIDLGLTQGHHDPTLVDNALVFFFDFKKHLSVLFRCTIAAQTQLLLVDGGINRIANQPKIRRVKIKTANGAASVLVGDELFSHLS